MHISIDTRPLHNQSASRGIGMYTSHLIKYLKQLTDIEIQEIKQGDITPQTDIVHYPWFDLFYMTLPIFKQKPTVVTIHDVTPLILPELYPPGIKGKIKHYIQKTALKNVSSIITDSQVSANDIHEHLQVPKNKITSIHLAPQDGLNPNKSTQKIQKIRSKYKLPPNYVLYVGDVNRNKNIISLIRACKTSDYPLVIVGKQATQKNYDVNHIETQDLKQIQTKYHNDPQIHFLGFVPTKDLGTIYNQALVYCQPSLYEGFGLPILEAMQCGCPVISSKKGSLPEIGNKSAIYVEPTIEKISQAIKFTSKLSKTQRTRLIQEGKKQAQKYSWQQTAKQVYEVYQNILT